MENFISCFEFFIPDVQDAEEIWREIKARNSNDRIAQNFSKLISSYVKLFIVVKISKVGFGSKKF